jgi:Fe-S-cluster containining protein
MQEERAKFVFNCQRCGRCCEQKEDIAVYLSDIEEWSKDGTIYQVFPNLSISEEFGVMSIQLQREDGKCILYDKDKKECTIYEHRPLTCRAYPLKYNGKGFLIKDKECPGLQQGEMSQESLSEIRNAAKNEQEEESRILMILPILGSILLKEIEKKSQMAYDELTDEEKEKLEEILKKEGSEEKLREQ